MFFSLMVRCAVAGRLFHRSSGVRSLWITNTPSCARPASGLEWRNTLGSGASTTFTCLSSQFSRMGSCASVA